MLLPAAGAAVATAAAAAAGAIAAVGLLFAARATHTHNAAQQQRYQTKNALKRCGRTGLRFSLFLPHPPPPPTKNFKLAVASFSSVFVPL